MTTRMAVRLGSVGALLPLLASTGWAQQRAPAVAIMAPDTLTCLPTGGTGSCTAKTMFTIQGDFILIEGLIATPRGVRGVLVGEQPATLAPASPDELRRFRLAGQGQALKFAARVPLQLGTNQVIVAATSSDGAMTMVALSVQRERAPDVVGPKVVLLKPMRSAPTGDVLPFAAGAAATVTLEAIVGDPSGVTTVYAAGAQVETTPVSVAEAKEAGLSDEDTPAVRFALEVPLKLAETVVPIIAVDALGNRTGRTLLVQRGTQAFTPGAPQIAVLSHLPDAENVIVWRDPEPIPIEFAAYDRESRMVNVEVNGERLLSIPARGAEARLRDAGLPAEANLYRTQLNVVEGDNRLVIQVRDSDRNVSTLPLIIRRLPPDRVGPVVTFLTPAPHEDGRRLAVEGAALVTGVALDASGVSTAIVNGVPAAVRAATDDELKQAQTPGPASAFEASIQLAMGRNPIVVLTTDSAGNITRAEIEVVRVDPSELAPPDTDAPLIIVVKPPIETQRAIGAVEKAAAEPPPPVPTGPPAPVVTDSVIVLEGLAYDASPIAKVEVSGVPTLLKEEPPDSMGPHVRFEIEVAVPYGLSAVTITAVDKHGNTRTIEQEIERRMPDPPQVALLNPAAPPAGQPLEVSSPQQFIVGYAAGGVGISQVLVNGQQATVIPADTTTLRAGKLKGTGVRFDASVSVAEGPTPTKVQIEARDTLGRTAVAELMLMRAGAREVAAPAGGAAGGTPRATKDALPRVHVLSVGVSDFTDARVPDLQYADDDARSFYQLLTSGPFGPSAKKLLLDKEVTRTSFMRELQYVLETSKRGDLVVLFMAMHGVEDPRGSGVYFLPSDAELNNLAGTGIAREDVMRLLGQASDRKVLMFIDACHSGYMQGTGQQQVAVRAAPEQINAFLLGISQARPGILVFNSASAYEVSREGQQWGGGHGVFTYYLLEALTGKADENRDGLIGIDELEIWVKTAVRKATNYEQTPMLTGVGDLKTPIWLVSQ